MGMYDTIDVYMECPYCGEHSVFDAQTKDLDRMMNHYRVYEGRKDIIDRSKLPVFKSVPNDKSAKVWKSQDEKAIAFATIPKQCDNLKFINVIASCHSPECQFDADREDIIRQGCPSGFGKSFEGKIAIKNGMLVGKIYDLKTTTYFQNALDKWKKLYPKEAKMLIKKYKHEPFAVRAWNKELPSFHRVTVDVKKKKIKSELVRFPTVLQPNEVIKQTTTRGKK